MRKFLISISLLLIFTSGMVCAKEMQIQPFANRLYYSDSVVSLLGKSATDNNRLLGENKKNDSAVKYKKYPKATFYYDNENICRLISAPLNNLFDIKGSSNISLMDIHEALNVEPYVGKSFNFDWFSYKGYLYILPKTENGLKPSTLVQVQVEQIIELDDKK